MGFLDVHFKGFGVVAQTALTFAQVLHTLFEWFHENQRKVPPHKIQ